MVRLPCTVYVLVTCSNPLKIRLRRLRRLRPVAAGCGRLRAVASGCKRLRPVASGCKRLQTPPARDLGFECLMCDDSTPPFVDRIGRFCRRKPSDLSQVEAVTRLRQLPGAFLPAALSAACGATHARSSRGGAGPSAAQHSLFVPNTRRMQRVSHAPLRTGRPW